MKRLTTIAVATISAGVISGSAFGLASAATSSSSTKTNNLVPRSVMRQERLQAVASVLNTSTTNVQNALKNHNLKQLISNAGLNRATFRQKVHAVVLSDLEAKGFTQDQINLTLTHREFHRLRMDERSEKSTN